MEGIYLISPSADVGYFDIVVPEQFKTLTSKVGALLYIFRAVKMADMGDDLIRRFRPYCDDFKKNLTRFVINNGKVYKTFL